jgi:hypothetical protein
VTIIKNYENGNRINKNLKFGILKDLLEKSQVQFEQGANGTYIFHENFSKEYGLKISKMG